MVKQPKQNSIYSQAFERANSPCCISHEGWRREGVSFNTLVRDFFSSSSDSKYEGELTLYRLSLPVLVSMMQVERKSILLSNWY